jgi:hypothetical protein
MGVTYRGLEQFGLSIVTPDDTDFRELAASIQVDPFGTRMEEPPSESFVVLNRSGKAILAMSVLWKWTDQEGKTGQSTISGLHSLAQLDWNPEKRDPRGSWFHPFLDGSKRLVTPQGTFGNNSDVLPPEAKPMGFVGASGMNRMGRPAINKVQSEVQLDFVIFADRTCAGPDQMGSFEGIRTAAAEQQRIASQAASMLRQGSRLGDIFEIVRTAARHPGPGTSSFDIRATHLLFSFGRQALDHLVHGVEGREADLARWFDEQSRVAALELRRADLAGN